MSNESSVFSFLPDGTVMIKEDFFHKTKEPWLML